MVMNETVILVLAGGVGVLLGVFFGGLWWTVRRGLSSKRPASLVSRQPAAANEHCPGWILFVSGGHWDRLLACLLGFVIARLIVTRLTRAADKPTCLAQEASHAP
jgi:F1F0 ATPase subunit 2